MLCQSKKRFNNVLYLMTKNVKFCEFSDPPRPVLNFETRLFSADGYMYGRCVKLITTYSPGTCGASSLAIGNPLKAHVEFLCSVRTDGRTLFLKINEPLFGRVLVGQQFFLPLQIRQTSSCLPTRVEPTNMGLMSLHVRLHDHTY